MHSNRHFYLLIFSLGVYAQIAQALLIREGLVVFYGNELSLGAFFASWLGWTALGAGSAWWLRAWGSVPLLRGGVLLLPVLLAGQIVATRLAREFMEVSAGGFLPLGDLFVALTLITLPGSFVLGLAFPLACRALEEACAQRETVSTVSRLYVFDALGALAGGILFTFVLIEWLGVWRSVGFIAVLLAGTWFFLNRDDSAIKEKAVGLFIGLAGVLLMATPAGNRVDWQLEKLRFATLQSGLELVDAVETRYGHVAVARLREQVSVVVDGRIAESFPQPEAAREEAAYFYAQSQARNVLLFGGAASDLPAALLRYPLARIDVVEQDERALRHVRPHLTDAIQEALDDPRVHVHFSDGRQFVRTPKTTYDLVLALDASPASAHGNRYFTVEFYRLIRAMLGPRGVFCTQVDSASNYLGNTVQSYSASVWHTLNEVFPHLALRPGDTQVYCATAAAAQVSEEPAVLAERINKTEFGPEFFSALLPADRIAYVRREIAAAPREINYDARPLTYYLNMLLWGKFSASGIVEWLEKLRHLGPWPYLMPLVWVVFLLMLRAGMEREKSPPPPSFDKLSTPLPEGEGSARAALLALIVLGMVAMAVQLTLLFSYQAHVGFIFGRIALLNGVFMTGLALGAGGPGRKSARGAHARAALIAVLGLCGAGLVGLPVLLASIGTLHIALQEGIYLGLTLITGISTGTGFPLGVRLAERGDTLRTGGLVQVADNLGGALGGFLTGALLVPVLGVEVTCYLLAGMVFLILLPLMWTPRYAFLKKRGGRAFPFPNLSWALWWTLLCVSAWTWLARGGAPGPQIQFEAGVLAEVSGAPEVNFEFQLDPFPHYRGGVTVQPLSPSPPAPLPKGEGSERIRGGGQLAALASQPVAAEVEGYAGPLNLLVVVDAAGVLRGVRYLDSKESPDYIKSIDAWLARLAGYDLAAAPLDPERVDALSGATLSSRAALESINRAARRAGETVFGKDFAVPEGKAGGPWAEWKTWVVLLVLLLFVPVYFRGGERGRLAYQVLVLVVLGLWLNTLVTEVDLMQLSLGRWPDWESNAGHALVLGFALASMLLLGQAYCGYVCPFGAAQELLSRAGRYLGLRGYAPRALDTRLRYLKFVLLALGLTAFWLSGEDLWLSFNPMQRIFAGHLQGWLLTAAVLGLGGALLYYRFWCRYLCPCGAFFALGNKLALLQRFAPQRRFPHCDLGVQEEFDVDCIRCQRCISGKDTHKRRAGHAPKAREITGN